MQRKPLSAPLALVWFHTRKVPIDQHRFDMHLFRVVQEGKTYKLESRVSRLDASGVNEAPLYALVKQKPQIVLANGGRDEAME